MVDRQDPAEPDGNETVVVPLASDVPPPDPSAGEPPPTGGAGQPPPDGTTDLDEQPEWYRNPRVIVPVAALVLLVGVLGGFLLFGSDDDADPVASVDSTTSSTAAPATSTTVAQSTTTAAPATTTTAAADGGGSAGGGGSDSGSSTDQAFVELELARGNWSGQPSGARYVMSYTVEGEGVGTWCVEGTVSDDNATVPFSQGQGCGSSDGPDPFGTLGVGQWHDQIADWISRGAFISASYDASGRPNQVATTEADGLTVTFEWLVPPGG